ncbi:AAA family ATPase [Microbacterium pumilum]|uniref:YhaN AAA domain-containing protein n=1 Tax=Microbacterium pumilum TaxID=344165 RepID=A0ABN2SYT1_9MICO
MKFERVDASAFGALRSESLRLSPQLTVIHGANEAGKSTWFAALYAGLVGRRVSRGRGTRTQTEFRRRHKPWTGSQWRAGVVVELASGQRLQIGHDLSTGDVTIKDLTNDRLTSVPRLESQLGLSLSTDGGFDGARLLGLNRESARSTMFVAQADILAVLRNVDELQEYLQRAATSTRADTTAEQALEWVAELRSARVGSPHVGNRPLRATAAALEAARSRHADALDARHRFRALHQSVATLEADVAAVERELTEIALHIEWAAIDELGGRIGRARQWTDEAAALLAEGEPAADDLVARVTTAVEGFKSRGDEPAPPTGPDAATLQVEISNLPEMPEGPRRPEPRATESLRALNEAEAARDTLLVTAPPEPVVAEVAGASSEQLRMLADRLTAVAAPEPPGLRAQIDELRAKVDADRAAHSSRRAAYERASEQYRRTQARYEAERSEYDRALDAYSSEATAYRDERARYDEVRARNEVRQRAHENAARTAEASVSAAKRKRSAGLAILVGGAVGLVIGVVLAVIGLLPVGIAIGALGIAGGVTGVVLARRTDDQAAAIGAELEPLPSVRSEPRPPTPPSAPEPFTLAAPGDAPEAPPALATALTELDRWEESVRSITSARHESEAATSRLGLPADPQQLRALARALDDRDAATLRSAEHTRRLREASEKVATAARTLASASGAEPTEEPAAARREFARYEADCAERDGLAREAERRIDLERALTERREREEAHARAHTTWLQAAAALSEAAQHVGVAGDDALPAVESWLQEQRRRYDVRSATAAVQARLDQLLEGATIEQLEEQRTARASAAGARPAQLMLVTHSQRSGVEAKRDKVREELANIHGRIRETAKTLTSIPEAIEAEARAESAAAAVQNLDSYLALAQTHLEIAKDRAHADIAPVLASTIRPWVPRVTDGRFVDVDIDVDTLMLRAVEQSGRMKDADVLSHGTMEQLFLLLRIALAKHLATGEEIAPLILDDVTVQSDSARTLAILDLLSELSTERQIVLFTQEQEVVDWAAANLPASAVIAL